MSQPRLIPSLALSRLRLAVLLLMAAAVAPALFRLWCLKGLVRTIRIDGPSMAETLRGDHFRVTCGDCGIIFRCDAGDTPADRIAVCPNCGFRENELRDEDLRRGDRVLVDTWHYLWSAPQRGDVVQLVDPLPDEAKPSYAVKRIAALPGEQLTIRDGDALLNDEPLRKSLRQLREVAVLVHDNDYRPKSLPTSRRWLPDLTASSWQTTPGGFRFDPARGGEIQWLTYQHWHCSANPLPRTSPAIIRDNDSYNQTEYHELHDVRDLLLQLYLRTESGLVVVSLQEAPHVFEVILKFPEGRFQVEKNGVTLVGGLLPSSASEIPLEVALCDGRFLLAHHQHVLANFPYNRLSASGKPRPPTIGDSRLRIGAAGGDVEISHVQVWRDIYYRAPTGGSEWQAEGPLAGNQYFLLGDNPPISIDSRHWPGGGVKRGDILGRVVLWRR